MGFITAFLNGAIGDHIVYVEQPLGYEIGVNLVSTSRGLFDVRNDGNTI